MAEGFDESKPQEVKTGADKLLELARESKEVPMAEAAKKLGVDQATIEAWADFLEEDGLIMVKYKFTTPYLTIPEPTSAKKRKQEIMPVKGLEFAELKRHLEDMNESLTKATEEKQAGEFGMLKQTYSSLVSRLKSAHDTLVEKAEISPQKKARINEIMAAIDKCLEVASKQAAEGSFDQASTSYSNLDKKAKAAIEEIKKLYEQAAALHAIEETKDYKDLIAKAYELINEGKVEEANELYNRLTFARENLAKEFNDRKRQMEDDLLKLNKDLSRSVDQANLKKVEDIHQRITTLLNAGNNFLKKNRFDIAESYYLAICHEYEALPPGFYEKKKELQQDVLGFYSTLAQLREKSIRKKFDSAAGQIQSLLKQTSELLKEAKINEAVRLYKEIHTIYRSLPAGFLKEKTELQEKILPVHSQITSIYTSESMSALKKESGEILALLSKMNACTEKGELTEAEQSYQKIRQLYRSMPKGFLHEETALQNQIIDAYERYLKKTKKTEAASASETLTRIWALVRKAEASLKAKDYATANEAYLKTIRLYSILPSGLVMQKMEIREKALRIYKLLLSLSTEQGLPEGKAAAKMAYPPISLPEMSKAPEPQNSEIHAVKPGIEPAMNAETEQGDAMKMNDEIENIEEKIEELKSTSKATVKYPYQNSR